MFCSCIVNASHSFSQVFGLFLWLVELCESQKEFNVLDEIYPSIFVSEKSADYDKKCNIRYLTYMLQLYFKLSFQSTYIFIKLYKNGIYNLNVLF